MSKDELIVTIEGIGGFRKTPSTSIKLKKGLSVITASNAVGKSSLVRALQLLCPGNKLKIEDMLNEYETSGSIELQNDQRSYVQLLKTAEGAVKMASTKLMWDDLRAINLGFCVPNAPLVQMIKENNQKDFKRWMRDISGAGHYETAINITTSVLRETEAEKENIEEVLKIGELEKLENQILELKKDKNEVDLELTKAEEKIRKLGAVEEIKTYETIKKELEKKIKERNKFVDEKNKKDLELNRLLKKQDQIVKQKVGIQGDINYLEKELDKKKKEEAEINKKKNEINLQIYGEKTGILSQINALKTSSEKDQLAIDNLKAQTANEAVIGECITLLTRRLEDSKIKIKDLEEEKQKLDKEFQLYNSQLEGIKQINREIQNNHRELLTINKESANLEKVIPQLQSEIAGLEKKLSGSNNDIGEIDIKMKKNIEKVQELTGMSEDLKNNMLNLQKQTRKLDKKLQELEIEKQHRFDAQEKYQEITNAVDKLEKFLNYLQSRYDFIIFGVSKNLNKELNEIFNLMAYTNFNKINIKTDPEIEIELVRKDGVMTKLSRLSTSEQLTITIIIMYVAKQAYAPDFPLFVIDEVMGSYDKTRFTRILKYIQNKVPYLVVTSLSPLEETGKDIVVKYTLS
ncbi:MAG TPA: hypothetical protein VMV49_03645 [Candidatus Deferrimicrobium sp.]|nr:hypothetical protein [Candidatus Deferrimicrobium sp.]